MDANSASAPPLTPAVWSERRSADVDGKSLADSIPIQADATDLPLQWRDGQDLAALVGREIQLIFELRAATLYSFSFSD